LHAATIASQAIAQIRQWSCMSACIMHSFEHAIPMAMHVASIELSATMSAPPGRIIMRMVVAATSAMFMHIEQQRAVRPAHASAHIVAA
jgi:hypothetical protein